MPCVFVPYYKLFHGQVAFLVAVVQLQVLRSAIFFHALSTTTRSEQRSKHSWIIELCKSFTYWNVHNPRLRDFEPQTRL